MRVTSAAGCTARSTALTDQRMQRAHVRHAEPCAVLLDKGVVALGADVAFPGDEEGRHGRGLAGTCAGQAALRHQAW